MFIDYLQPVSKELQDFAKSCNSFCLGATLNFEKEISTNTDEILSFDKIAIIGVQETRSNNNDELEELDFDIIRRTFYDFKMGNWVLPIYDFGDLTPSHDKISSGEMLTKVLTALLKENYFVIILGGSPSMSYYQYRAFDTIKKNINYFGVDEKLRFGNEIQNPNDENYLTKIISSEPFNLLDFSNIGYQTYFVAQEELDLIGQLNFEAHRLGTINQSIQEVEPIVREADAGMINLSSIEGNCFKSTQDLTPNGFNSREICGVAKYIGSSSVLKSIYISNYLEKYKKLDHMLLSQIIWYILDGRNHRPEIKNFDDAQYFEKIFVPSDIQIFVFYRNIITDQWWIEIKEKEEDEKVQIVPCSKSDYLKALEGDIPNKWWKYFKKFY